MAEYPALDVEALLDQHADERRTERGEDLARQDRMDRLIAEALARRPGPS